MIRIILFIALFIFQLLLNEAAIAAGNPPGFINVVNPVRGEEYWDFPDQKPVTVVNNQLTIAK